MICQSLATDCIANQSIYCLRLSEHAIYFVYSPHTHLCIMLIILKMHGEAMNVTTINSIWTWIWLSTPVNNIDHLILGGSCSPAKVQIIICPSAPKIMLRKAALQWRMQDFLKGGSVIITRANFMPRPLFVETTPIFKRFWEKLLSVPVNPFIFDRDLC